MCNKTGVFKDLMTLTFVFVTNTRAYLTFCQPAVLNIWPRALNTWRDSLSGPDPQKMVLKFRLAVLYTLYIFKTFQVLVSFKWNLCLESFKLTCTKVASLCCRSRRSYLLDCLKIFTVTSRFALRKFGFRLRSFVKRLAHTVSLNCS